MSSLMLVFTACDPMEDVYDELDKASKDETVVNTELVKADYDVYKENTDFPHVAAKQYFLSEDEAAELVPAMLNKRYPHLENGATVTVAYNTPIFPGIGNSVSSWEKYTVTAEDYTANGESYPNFNSSGDVYKFLGAKYPDAAENQLVVLTYDYYAGSKSTITDSFYYMNGRWENIYHVTSDDYLSVKNTYASFSGSDSDNMVAYFDLFLKKDVIVAKEGDFEYVSYYFYDSSDKSRTQRVMAMYFNGSNWVPAVGATEKATLKFQKKQGEWVPDLSVLYTLIADDYTDVANSLDVGTQAARDNLKRFGNFNTYSWSTEDLYKAMNFILKKRFPNAEVDQKFKVTFDSYPAGAMELILKKRADGEFTKLQDGE